MRSYPKAHGWAILLLLLIGVQSLSASRWPVAPQTVPEAAACAADDAGADGPTTVVVAAALEALVPLGPLTTPPLAWRSAYLVLPLPTLLTEAFPPPPARLLTCFMAVFRRQISPQAP